ncbi:nuclear pore membrane glycoprotein 210-like [Teleopsis dalmanni]|uniref:nuclear pore membrane glycoprotein 210-like n=1 Tax=Teleopsis dalmanni TaxID=139649 RepID=UPI0018CF4EF3|nr:nuclear pore membrane glycoprotein 210-like [Teleopsis dalmanni]
MCRLKVFLLLFLFSFITINNVESTKLNYPRVLLPIFDKISINFTLEVIEKGCFKWTSSRQDLILITPLYDDSEECSHRATVTVVSRERRRNTAIVLAESLSTDATLRCDVIIDVIDKLGVHTTTRQLYLEEAPETFELRAEDSQGNAFTTLEGVEFNWEISSITSKSKGWLPALRFLSFSESEYHEVPSSLEKFEVQRMKGYMVLLEGINTGTAKVTVSLPHEEYRHVNKIEVFISVLANIILEPSEVHMLTGDTINFRILQLKMGKLQEISLNNQYYLEIDDNTVASIDDAKATGLKLGRTVVVLRDRNAPLDNNFSGDNSITKSSAPSARLTVARPFRLGVTLLPFNNWITVAGEMHIIAFDLYTSDDKKLTLGSKYSVVSELSSRNFEIKQENTNGSRLYGEALHKGTVTVSGQFKQLSVVAEMHIYDNLVLVPSTVILPFDPQVNKIQQIQFEANGGDGFYIWQSQNSRDIQITQNGLATTIIRDTDRKRHLDAYYAGTVLRSRGSIRVALTKNPKIIRQADIFFMPPVKLQIVKYNFETALDDFVRIHLALHTFVNGTYVPFTTCDMIDFDLEFSNKIFQVEDVDWKKEHMTLVCQVIHLRATATGLTHLKISYQFQDKLLKEEVTLSVFDKLDILNPTSNEIVLPIGASRNIIYMNGQQRIFTLEAELVKETEYDQSVAKINELDVESSNAIYAYNILCTKIGSTTLDFKIFNKLVPKNFLPYTSKILTEIHCVAPRFLNLYATEKLRPTCPMQMKLSLLHLKDRDEKFEIEIEVQDAQNRRLMNISSLLIDWKFAVGDERFHSDSTLHYRRNAVIEFIKGVPIPSKDLFVTTFPEPVPNFRIRGDVTNYIPGILNHFNIRAETPVFAATNHKTQKLHTPSITNEISFMAVNSTLFLSDHVSIFMAKQHREHIPIAQGSGYYDFTLSETGIVNIEFLAKERELILTPLRMGHTRLELLDRCLMTDPAQLSISVVSIGAIVVDVPDRVERTKTVEAIVRLYDSNDNLLTIDSNNLEIYDLHDEIFNSNILSIQLGDQKNLGVGEIRYIVTGNSLGETKIVFNSHINEYNVSSEPATIQVFPPLRLYPRNSTLVVGSSVQIYYQGGPQPDVNIVYYVHNEKLITMESALVTAHKLGATQITGKCIMPNTGSEEIVISVDTVDVSVVPLENVQIKTPLTRIRSGAVMPATVWGMPDLSPMVLGTLENMRVTWSTNQPDVVDIYNIFTDAVFKNLELELPKRITMDWILVAPRSTIQLKSNLDNVVYKPDSASNGIVKVTKDGIVNSQDVLGRDLIIAKTFEQSLPIGIEVKNVQYILASLTYPTIKLKHIENTIPRGMNFVLKISLHDNLGNEFSHNIEEINDIKYDLSHKDIVDVQIGNNMTVAINLPRETNNMIAISLKDTTGVKYAEDYIKLSVAESKHIYPTKTIFSVGDIICFDSPLALSSIWTSSDEQTVSIDRFTGVARVFGNRFKLSEKVIVTNGDVASGSFIKYDVEVREADVLQLLKSFDIFSGSTYRGYLIIRNHLQIDKYTNLIAKNVSKCSNIVEKINAKLFTCRLTSKQALGQKLLEHYKVRPIFESSSGRYACEIDLISNFNEVFSIVKNNDVHFELEAQLPNGLSDSLSLKFVPGVKVLPDALYANNLNEQEITITGLDKILQNVEVKSSDAKLLDVTLNNKAHGTLQYKIYVLNTLPVDEKISIIVHSPTTQQDIEIPILGANTLAPKCSTQPFDNIYSMFLNILSNIGLIITGLMILATTLWVYFSCGAQGKVKINSEAFASTKKDADTSDEKENPAPRSPTLYPNLSPYYDPRLGSPNLSPGNDSPVYGDSTLRTPQQQRIYRRYL